MESFKRIMTLKKELLVRELLSQIKRIEKLETELKEARERIEELEGGNELKKPTPPPNIKGTFAI
jgi:prefoldin subunit 5